MRTQSILSLGCALTWLTLCGCPSKTPVQPAPKPGPVAELAPEPSPAQAEPAPVEPIVSQSTDKLVDPTVDPTVEMKVSLAVDAPAVEPVPRATWSTQHIVVFGQGGPRFIAVKVNVGGRELISSFQESCGAQAQELELKFEESKVTSWSTLLDKPLIASGWLGNLVASAEQREQLIGLYDADKDQQVDQVEFEAFLTRGLSRQPSMRLTAGQAGAPPIDSPSPWGPIDQNADGDLSRQELSETTQSLMRYDFDADRILTFAELRSAADTTDAMASANARRNQSEIMPVHAWDLAKSESMAQAVFDNYSFSETIDRELFRAWSDERFRRIDTNGDGEIDRTEMRAAPVDQLDAGFEISFPQTLSITADKHAADKHAADEQSELSHQLVTIPNQLQGWEASSQGGRLLLDGCVISLLVEDEHAGAVRQSFIQQVDSLAQNAAVAAIFTQVLELQPGAIDLLKSSAEAQKVDAGALAWHWLATSRHYRTAVTWSASEAPWFELLDSNADRKLAATELERFAGLAVGWDIDKNGSIDSTEMPVSILLSIKRADPRLQRSRLGGSTVEKRGTNERYAPTWFTGMDYNFDGELSKSEFLGDDADFQRLDRDQNGIIEAREIDVP